MPNGDALPPTDSDLARDVWHLKRVIYGYPDIDSNDYVDGLVQNTASVKTSLAEFRESNARNWSVALKVGCPPGASYPPSGTMVELS
jgi:hypothetical protein